MIDGNADISFDKAPQQQQQKTVSNVTRGQAQPEELSRKKVRNATTGENMLPLAQMERQKSALTNKLSNIMAEVELDMEGYKQGN